MRFVRDAAFAMAFLGLAAGPTSAQTAAPAPKTDLDTKSGTLSDKLGATGGVIKPTGNVDPEMHRSAPQSGSMPVIEPGRIAPQGGGASQGDKGGLR